MKNVRNKVFLIFYVILLGLLGWYIFSANSVPWKQNSDSTIETKKIGDHLRIGYANRPAELNPLIFKPETRNFIVDIYEGLVKTDKNLAIKPGVAVSWGRLNATTWEFVLRQEIKFHDGSFVTAEDVVYSIERAKNDEKSELKDVLNSIKKIETVSPTKIHIITNYPDPLLLEKMAVTYIFSKDTENTLGTGPYRLLTHNDERVVLEKFDEYWGEKPSYQQVTLSIIPEKNNRLSALEKEEIDILANVPPHSACSKNDTYSRQSGCENINNNDILIVSTPSLEVSFLAFNMHHQLLKQRSLRSALAKLFDQKVFIEMSFGFAKPVSQFVSNGVMGFNPEITVPEYDINEAKKRGGNSSLQSF
jgi:peptide/nickel transport system substrate-binding protein